MSFISATKTMDSFYQNTIMPMLIPVAGPLAVSPLIGIIALVDLAVSTIFKCTQTLTQKEEKQINRHFEFLHNVFKYHGINFVTLGIFPWIGVIQDRCCKN